MILRIFLLFVLAIVLAVCCRGFLMRHRFKKDLQSEKVKMQEFLQSVLKAQEQKKNNNVQEIFPCMMCGVCLPESDGVRDENGHFFCSSLHLESYQKHGTR